MHLNSYRYQGQISAALVLGGVDCTGAHLYNIYPHGSSDKLPYVTMGSGSLAAMSVSVPLACVHIFSFKYRSCDGQRFSSVRSVYVHAMGGVHLSVCSVLHHPSLVATAVPTSSVHKQFAIAACSRALPQQWRYLIDVSALL
jgi:Proteasome subunit